MIVADDDDDDEEKYANTTQENDMECDNIIHIILMDEGEQLKTKLRPTEHTHTHTTLIMWAKKGDERRKWDEDEHEKEDETAVITFKNFDDGQYVWWMSALEHLTCMRDAMLYGKCITLKAANTIKDKILQHLLFYHFNMSTYVRCIHNIYAISVDSVYSLEMVSLVFEAIQNPTTLPYI